MASKLDDGSVLHAPPLSEEILEGGHRVLIDRDGPNWLATSEEGAAILGRFDGRRRLGEVAAEYALRKGLSPVKAWQHVDTVVRDSLRAGILAEKPFDRAGYAGREAATAGLPLEELWVHTNNSCNLRCTHCLVSSGPEGSPGLGMDEVLSVVEQARDLGTRRFYFTGGEPFLRRDLLDLVDAVLADPGAELAILTNAILLPGKRLQELAARDRERLRLQVSLDGSCAAVNDPIRGKGSFERTCRGVRAAVEAGIRVTISSVITAANAEDVPRVTMLAAELGARDHHLLWLHKRGRADDTGTDRTPSVERVIATVREARAAAAECGIVLDNHEALKARIRAPAGVKRDLSNACVTSLCVYSDGTVYPSAATAGDATLRCGDLARHSLRTIWEESETCRRFRAASVVRKPLCGACPLRFLCGGGDLEHSYYYGGTLEAHDPYCELHKAMFHDAFAEVAAEKAALLPGRRAGFDAPVAVAFMGEEGVHCDADRDPREVEVSHSECVVSFDVDGPRTVVRGFYGAAAEAPQAELCCPVRPDEDDLAHIPSEVVERFYGCGSPVARAGIRPGETTLDLGSGAGIDVFIAARRVGREGRAIGVDMTDAMLKVAEEARPEVAKRLGYDVVEFRRGFLEEVPAEDASVDLVTSNCVVNLSPDKKRVFGEVWRVLRDHGRVVLSDIVSEDAVPPAMRRNPRLWGECISGALTEEELVDDLERAGFHGVTILARTFWKEVDGHRFLSVTLRGEKFEKKDGCVFAGHSATYLGPFKGVSDEEGHWFPRNRPVAVCTDTVAKLSHGAYTGQFRIEGPDGVELPEGAGADPSSCDGGKCC